jgi:hypothetical protein
MAIDDLDRDGALDLALGRSRSDCNDILLLRGAGNGTFLPNENRVITDRCDDLPRFTLGDQTGDAFAEILALDGTGVTTYTALGALAFERRIDLSAPNAVEQILTADVDSDGRLDLVYSFESSKSLGIRLGNGDGTFRTATNVSAALFVDLLGAGDLDRDGDIDLVVASSTQIGVLLGAGNGAFLSGALVPLQSFPSALRVADVTGDGAADVIAALGSTDRLVMYESRGDGTLESPVTSVVGDAPSALAVEDFDRDGRVDIAVANSGSDDLSVLSGVGNGAFAPEVRYSVADFPVSIAAADFDLDGDSDLVVAGGFNAASSGGPNAMVLLGDGNGGFVPQPRFTPATVARQVTIADADADGLPDLLMLHPVTFDVSILLGVGEGSFQAQERARTGQGPLHLAVADLDTDGRPDLVTANSGSNGRPGLSVLLHR